MPNHFCRKLCLLALLICVLAISAVKGASLSPGLEKILSENNNANDSLISVVIFLDNDQGGREAAKSAKAVHLSLKVRHEKAVIALKTYHKAATSNIKDKILSIFKDAQIKEFWIAPALAVTIPASGLEILATFSDISGIYEDGAIEVVQPVEMDAAAYKTSAINSHLYSLNVPALWARGITGKGRLVCNFDTGVEGTHPALQDKWRGNHSSNSSSWFAPSSTNTSPFDATGHGTHTMGLMVGSADADSFGVAPDAEWIAAAVIDQGQSLSKTFADIIAAFQWAVDPDGNPATNDDVPDVILNSWGVPTSIMEPCDETFYQVIDNVEAAGVVTIFAAGNEGPDPQTLRIPANRAGSPYNSFAVGAIDGSTNTVAGFSSRGPSSCSPTQKKPEVVAPGVGIYSSSKNGSYAYKNGTSMAAPLIAGIVALLRQYNPNATVDEIKNAIILSCRDLGPAGEDNDYGYGLPDADVALRYIPTPPANFEIKHQFISGDGIAEPGETFDLQIGLGTDDPGIDSATAILDCNVSGVTIDNDESTYIFANKGNYSINTNPFVISFAGDLTNGQIIPMNLKIYLPFNGNVDTVGLQIMVGLPMAGTMVTHTTQKIKFTVSDFGQYGLGENSVYFAGGDGFRFMDSDNLLYESGIIIGRNSLQLSSSIRDSLGNAMNSDFSPVEQINIFDQNPSSGFGSRARFTDTGSEIPIPIIISQQVTSYYTADDESYLIFKYNLINNSNEYITNLSCGFLNDFDLDLSGDSVGYDEGRKMAFQSGNGQYVGIIPLTEFGGLAALENGTAKRTFTNSEKYNILSQSGIDISENGSGDYMMLLNFGPFYIGARDSVAIAFVIVAAENISQLQYYADRAMAAYYGTTDVAENDNMLPRDFTLRQNYPNPFNPTTTISFNIRSATIVNLAVFNILGQKVKTLKNDIASAGEHRLVWDGIDNDGYNASSGIYFYRLTTDSGSRCRKMLLVK